MSLQKQRAGRERIVEMSEAGPDPERPFTQSESWPGSSQVMLLSQQPDVAFVLNLFGLVKY